MYIGLHLLKVRFSWTICKSRGTDIFLPSFLLILNLVLYVLCDEQIGEVTACQLFHLKVAVLRTENLHMVRVYIPIIDRGLCIYFFLQKSNLNSDYFHDHHKSLSILQLGNGRSSAVSSNFCDHLRISKNLLF